MSSSGPKPPPSPAPLPILWPEATPATKQGDSDTRPFAVPFELLEQSRREEVPLASLSSSSPSPSSPSSPFDAVPGAPTFQGTPSQGFGAASTSKFRLDDFLGNTGDMLLLGDPLDIATTAVIRVTRSSEDGSSEETTTTSICIGRDIERMLGPATVLGQNKERPHVELSAFEEFVLGALDGSSPIEALCTRSGLSMGDLRIALALLADKGQLVVVSSPPPPPPVSPPPATREPESPWDVPSTGSMPEPTLVSRTFAPITVLRRVAGADPTGLSALEQFVWSKIDGERTVQGLRDVTGLSESDIALALELMQRRGLVERPAPPRVRPLAAPAPAPLPPPPPPRAPPPAPPPAPVIVSTTPVTTARTQTSTPMAAPPRPPSSPPTPAAPRLDALLADAERKEDRGDFAGAVALLQQAVRLEPKNGALHNRLGIALVRQHNLPAAVAALNEALALSPADPTIVSNHARISALAQQLLRRR